MICPEQVVVVEPVDVEAAADEVSVATEINRVAADVVYGMVVVQFPWRSSNWSMR
jgi:hypothetical protein